MSKLRDAARDKPCIRCGRNDGTTVGAHYTGARRLSYGGGYGIKVDDLFMADLCSACHMDMDTLSRDKARRWEHSEEFQHLILLTIKRRAAEGLLRF